MRAEDSTAGYFQALNSVLKNQGPAIPSLLVDLDVLDENLAAFRRLMNPQHVFRLVVKSIPSPLLIRYITKQLNTNRLMVFHLPFLHELTESASEETDILLGKPMPSKTASHYYHHLPEFKNGFDPYQQVQWLVDTQKRVVEYIELAKSLGQKLRLNLEIDVGLRRGGFRNEADLKAALELIKTNADHVAFSGFMGYDPHVVKIPKVIRSQQTALKMSTAFYESCKKLVREQFPELWHEQLTFNGAGSPTLGLHQNSASPLNEVAAGSCFVKPATFDMPSLNQFKPACFIATPVLKKFKGTTLPGIERYKSLLNLTNAKNAQSFFLYGGYWMADYVYPEGLSENSLFGSSTNQTMVNAPLKSDLNVDDFVFLRPQQSEFVFLQFGKLRMVRGGEIVDSWPVFRNDY